MIVPSYWAEARARHRDGKRQITIKRFGWSNESVEAASAMAQARANEALAEAVAGKQLKKLERKVAYNGAEGVPIREEVISRHGDSVITRNAYGARCLNSPTALFADVDFVTSPNGKSILAVVTGFALIALLLGVFLHRWGVGLVLFIVGGWLSPYLIKLFVATRMRLTGGLLSITKVRIEKFIAERPGWGVRVYETPAGLRLLATHRQFASDEPEVRAFFDAVHADKVYRQMCINQKCFRARLTAKPWRIGISDHIRPRPGVWPINADKLPLRNAWIAKYEEAAANAAACRYVETIGNSKIDANLAETVSLHDQESQALDVSKPIA
jgi:hypothetical protein